MGTKITTIEYIGPGRLTITAEAIGQARVKLQRFGSRTIPEGCFIDDTALCLTTHPSNGAYTVMRLEWVGNAASWLEHLATALSYTRGSADLLLVWDGGKSMDPFVGLRVQDGIVTKRAVVMSLGEEVD